MKTTFVGSNVKGQQRVLLLGASVLAAVSFFTSARAFDPPAAVPTPPAFTEAVLLAAPPPGPYKKPVPLLAAARTKSGTASPSPPQIAAVFWYSFNDATGMGFRYGDGTDAVSLHPAQLTGYSYKNVAWYKRELRAMRGAGVDVALCEFWGSPADRALKPGEGQRWSFDGLGPMVRAAEQLSKTPGQTPQIGLCFDAGSFVANAAHFQPDLATNDGRAWLYVGLRDFFSLVPPRLRATGPNHGPLVFVTYAASFVKNGEANAALWEYLRAHFAADFGVEPYFVLQEGWQADTTGADATFPQASAPIDGLRETEKIAAIGPGVNQQADPHHKEATPAVFRDRENGAFYEKQWRKLLAQSPQRRPRFVFVESWNQWQQATAIAPSREYGDKYVRLTRKWADLFHKGIRVPLSASSPYRHATRISWFAAAPSGDTAGNCLRLVAPPDGAFVLAKTALGGAYVEARDNPHGSLNHLYFDVNDDFVYDTDDFPPAPLTMTFEYWNEGRDVLRIQYDAAEPGQTKQSSDRSAYTIAAELPRTDTHTWKTGTVVLPYPRFANRQNGGADVRFQSAKTAPLRLRWVTIRRSGNSR